jgi:hypothetical protein
MKGSRFGALSIVILALAGCASVPEIRKGAANYLEQGMVSATLKGGEFYMGIGEVDLYDDSLFGGLRPTGRTVEIAVAIQADKDTGQVLKIVTLQSNSQNLGAYSSDAQNNVTIANGAPFVVSDLRGGISIIDLQPYPHWLDAINSMRDAIGKLSTYTNFISSRIGERASVVAVTVGPDIRMGWDLAWRWGPDWDSPWPGHFHRRFH